MKNVTRLTDGSRRMTTIRLPPARLTALKAEAKTRGWSRGKILEQLVAKHPYKQGISLIVTCIPVMLH